MEFDELVDRLYSFVQMDPARMTAADVAAAEIMADGLKAEFGTLAAGRPETALYDAAMARADAWRAANRYPRRE